MKTVICNCFSQCAFLSVVSEHPAMLGSSPSEGCSSHYQLSSNVGSMGAFLTYHFPCHSLIDLGDIIYHFLKGLVFSAAGV